MSSREGIPVDVMYVVVDPGRIRVPAGVGLCFVDRRLKEDMVVECRNRVVVEIESARLKDLQRRS